MKRMDAIDARLAAATPPPWAASKDHGAVVSLDPDTLEAWRQRKDDDLLEAYGGAVVGESMGQADQDLVANAPADLAWATALLRQLLAGLAQVDDELHEGRHGNARRRVQELVKAAIAADAT